MYCILNSSEGPLRGSAVHAYCTSILLFVLEKNDLTAGFYVMLLFPHITWMFYNHQKWQLPVTQGKLDTTNGQLY